MYREEGAAHVICILMSTLLGMEISGGNTRSRNLWLLEGRHLSPLPRTPSPALLTLSQGFKVPLLRAAVWPFETDNDQDLFVTAISFPFHCFSYLTVDSLRVKLYINGSKGSFSSCCSFSHISSTSSTAC